MGRRGRVTVQASPMPTVNPQIGEWLHCRGSLQGVRGLSPTSGSPVGVPESWGKEIPLLKGSHKTSHVPGPRAEPVIWKKPGSGLPSYLRKSPEHRWEATEFHPGTQTLNWWKSFWGVHSTTWILIQERFWSLPSSLLNLRTQPCPYPIASSGTPQIKELTGCGKAPPTSREAALKTP